jgi:ABC-type branched-subunit amino acid transport system substrate-binding protein
MTLTGARFTASAIRRRSRRTASTLTRSLAALITAAGLVTAAGLPAASAAAAARTPAPGVTATSVLIGSDQPLTGVSATGYGEIGPASQAFFDFVNARGGVRGRMIDYTVLDDASSPATAAADEARLVNSDHVFAYLNGFGNTEHTAVVASLNAAGVPDLFVGSSCECWNQPRKQPDTFGFGTDYPDEGRLTGSYVARTFPAAKIGYIFENGLVGCCQQGVRELDSEIPATRVVARESFTVADIAPTRLLPQVRALQAAGAQVLVLDTLVPAATALVLLDAASIGYHPVIADPFRLSADPATVGTLIRQFSGGKASPALENGLVTEDYLPSASDTANPWIRLFRRIHDTYEPRAPFDNMTVYGMTAAYNFTRALRAAGAHPTRRSIIDAVNDGAVNHGGPGLAPLAYSPFNHDGYLGEQIGTVQNGGIVLSGPVFITHGNGPVISVPPAATTPPRHF